MHFQGRMSVRAGFFFLILQKYFLKKKREPPAHPNHPPKKLPPLDTRQTYTTKCLFEGEDASERFEAFTWFNYIRETHPPATERTNAPTVSFFFSTTSATTPFVCILILIGFDSPNRADVIKFFSSRHIFLFRLAFLLCQVCYICFVWHSARVLLERERKQKTHGCYLSEGIEKILRSVMWHFKNKKKFCCYRHQLTVESVFRLRCVCIV